MPKPIEDQPRLDVHRLYRAGALLGGGISEGGWAGQRVTIRAQGTCITVTISGRDTKILLVWLPGTLGGTWPSARCPQCDRRLWHLYLVGGVLGCRKCLELDHATRIRWSPAAWQALRARRLIGADSLQPFS